MELKSLAWSARKAYVALTLGTFECWKALWADRARDKKFRLQRSVSSLFFQWGAYLRESHKVYTSLQEVNKALALFNLPGSECNRVMHLEGMIERMTGALDSSQKELEFLHNQNDSLIR